MKFHQKLIKNAEGATQSPMSLRTASEVIRGYGNRHVMPNFRWKYAANEIG